MQLRGSNMGLLLIAGRTAGIPYCELLQIRRFKVRINRGYSLGKGRKKVLKTFKMRFFLRNICGSGKKALSLHSQNASKAHSSIG